MKGQKSTFVGVKLLKNIENFCRQKESASFGDTSYEFIVVFCDYTLLTVPPVARIILTASRE